MKFKGVKLYGYLGKVIFKSKRTISSRRSITIYLCTSCCLCFENGEIYTGFCIESCCGVLDLCAERTAALNIYINSGQTVIKRLIAFRDKAPFGKGSGMPCGACREFLMQLNIKNKDTEIMVDYKNREIITLGKLLPDWWGIYRYEKNE